MSQDNIDYAGAAVAEKKNKEEAIGSFISTAGETIKEVPGLGIVGALIMAGGSFVQHLLGTHGSEKLEQELAFSEQYKNALPSIDSLNQLYGGAIDQRSAAENNEYGLAMYERAYMAARETGLDTDDFIAAMTRLSNYGITDESQALAMTREQALWSRYTGADLEMIQKYGGQTYRYGGETDAVSTAYGGLMAQDMGKGQFTEYLNSIGRILEEGISRGFVRSTEEIAGNMQMLYRLSGESLLWQGEQGASRLSQMNAAIANATDLQSVEDVISFSAAKNLLGSDNREADFYRLTGGFTEGTTTATLGRGANFRSSAGMGDNVIDQIASGSELTILDMDNNNSWARVNYNGTEGYVSKDFLKDFQNSNDNGNVYTGTYVDVMQLLERGVSADLLKDQWSMVRGLEGDNRAGMIEWFRKMYNLDYTGAAQVWEMSENAWDRNTGDWKADFNAGEFEQQIKDLQENSNYRSDSQLLQDTLNSLKNDSVKIGKIEFDNTEMGLIRKASEEIAEILRKKNGPTDVTGMAVDEAVSITRNEWRNASLGREATNAYFAYEQAVQNEHNYHSKARDIKLRYPTEWRNLFSTRGDTEEAQADRRDYNAIRDTIHDALSSNYWDQLTDVEVVFSLIKSIPDSTRREWNDNNSINQLAEASDIKQLRDVLQTLIRDGIKAELTGEIHAETRE